MESRADKVIRFIHTHCMVPEGALVGQPLKLEPFQIDFIKDVYDNPMGTKTGILSIGRKNGKSAIIACLLLAHLVGPEAKQNSQISSGAMSRENAALVFDLACKMIGLNPSLAKVVRIVPSLKILHGLPLNVEYKALSADGKKNMGGSPVLAILDEVGQIIGPKDWFVDAVVTSQGAHESPLLLAISTQAANDGDLFSIWIDDAMRNEDPHTVCHVHKADEGADVLDEKGWRAANPALGVFRSESDMRAMAEKASRMPSFENSFRNLYLNQRVSVNTPFISKNVWKECGGKQAPIEECTEIYAGLDLSARTDLTAFVLYGFHENIWNVYPYFWTPEQGLADRVNRDRTPYDVWVKQGFLLTTPGATVDYEFVVHQIAELTSHLQVTAIAYDRWRMDIIKKECERIGLELPFVEWGQGFKDMSPALDALEEKMLNKTLRHGGHPVLTMCSSNASVTKDPSGNRKLDKTKTSGRIDGLVALAMAAGIAERQHEQQGALDDFLSAPLKLKV
jgi:phage terminase large subunit-like protein